MTAGLITLAICLPVFAGEGNEAKARAEKERAKAAAEHKERTPVIKERQQAEAHRIKEGVKDGSLTHREAAGLAAEQAKIKKMREAAAQDGKVTPGERKDIRTAEGKASRDIYKQRHDAQGTKAKADPNADPGVNRRQINQATRIANGIRTGRLTEDETKTIVAKEQEFAQFEANLKADGKLTVDERKQLHQQLDDLSKLIYQEKHDEENALRLKQEIKDKIDGGEMTGAEAKGLVQKMRRMCTLRQRLGSGEKLTDEEQANLFTELQNHCAQIHE
jgi:hypothetical protein